MKNILHSNKAKTRLLVDYKDIYYPERVFLGIFKKFMAAIPVYDIEQFHYRGMEESFYASTISAHLYNQPHTEKPHRYDFYSTILITKGSGASYIDLNSYLVKPGYVFLVHPGQVHSWKLSADIEGFVIFHTKEFYDLKFTSEWMQKFLFFGAGSSPLIRLSGAAHEQIGPIFYNIENEYRNERIMKFQKICSLLNILYIELSQLYLPQKQNNNQNVNQLAQIRQLEDFIDKNYKALKFPKQYAALMNMSQKHLNRIVKLTLGKTTSGLISERIVLEAKRMLAHSTLSISQIALELGYEENGYFFRVFKNKSGQTPAAFMHTFRKT